jgi:protein gp37
MLKASTRTNVMTAKTRIEWTEVTWNPVTGCTKLSQGCKHCYAERMAHRLKAMRNPRYPNGFEITLHEDLIDAPRRWKKPTRVFVNSMSDLFHEAIPPDFVERLFHTMAECPQHQFQILTKRGKRLRELAPSLPWPKNLWMGVSVEHADVVGRIDDLRTVPAAVRFLSCEPLLGPLAPLRLEGIHWIIVGGESGSGARKMEPQWVYKLRDQCLAADVPFFFKQWGGVRKDLSGRELDGRTYDALPNVAGRC